MIWSIRSWEGLRKLLFLGITHRPINYSFIILKRLPSGRCTAWCTVSEAEAWIDWLPDFCYSAKHWSHPLWQSATERYFLQSERPVVVQVDHNKFDHDRGKTLNSSAIVNGLQGDFLYAYPRSNNFAFNSGHENLRLAKAMKMEKAIIPLDTVFIGQGTYRILQESAVASNPTISYASASKRSGGKRSHCFCVRVCLA